MTARADLIRELDKIGDTIGQAVAYLSKVNEANAALHLNDKVFYSPLTAALVAAGESVGVLRRNLDDGDDGDGQADKVVSDE